MVPGNHEYISGIDESVRFLKDTPIQLLRDSVVTLPNGVQIIGRDDRSNRSRHSLPTLLKQADRSKPIILLDNQPYNLAKTDSLGIDLQFSGHTHHGQIWPISWVTRLSQVDPITYLCFQRIISLGASFQNRNKQRYGGISSESDGEIVRI